MNPKNIIHLDDHSLITIGIGNLLKKIFPDSQCHGFTDTEKAWQFIKTSLLRNDNIELIITDFIHNGPNGYEFAKSIRELERKKNVQPIPIILLTMANATEPLVKRGLKTKIFNKYLCLNSSEKEIVQAFSHFAST